MPASEGRDLAAVPNGTLVMTSVKKNQRQESAIVAGGAVWWKGRRFDTASAAARAMRGADEKQVNGWKVLLVLAPAGALGTLELRKAYDEGTFAEPLPWTRAALRVFIGDIKPENLGLTVHGD